MEHEKDGGLHLHKKWDDAIVEEIKDLHIKCDEFEERLAALTRGPDGHEVCPQMMWHQLNDHAELLQELKKYAVDPSTGYGVLKGDNTYQKPICDGARYITKYEYNFLICALAILFLGLLVSLIT